MRIAYLLALAVLVAAGPSRAATCSPISGTVETQFGAPCAPVGVCTTGVLDAGALRGTTGFTATSLEKRGAVTAFGGVFTVTNDTGTATYATEGILNNVTGMYVERFTLVSGTGAYAGASGNFSSTGLVGATGFGGDVRGALCLP